MNKLILVGNGFDLAHGLPTSYKDFLDDFWAHFHKNFNEIYVKNVIHYDGIYNRIPTYICVPKNFIQFEKNIISYQKDYSAELFYYNYKLKMKNSDRVIFEFKNDFFKLINLKNSIQNWVDIEQEFYNSLKRIAKAKERQEVKRSEIIKLNKEFNEVKQLLNKYLIKLNNLYNFNDSSTSYQGLINHFLKNNFFREDNGHIKNYSNEFSYLEDKREILDIPNTIKELFPHHKVAFNVLFLDFNYTATTSFYLKRLGARLDATFIRYSLNKIHGDLNNFIFGFGDETDSDYKLIEDINDNEYLKNFKSFYYSENNNYDKLLQFIDSSKYQVLVMGHSCGLSDRVLLNTIFEHKNCRSIKIYYHKKTDGSDNFQDIVMNISRHFKDKSLMRRIILSKELCSPLPQTVRFKKVEKKE